MTRKTVFILSHVYSGSTWLSLLLGSHSKALYLGELNKFYSKKFPMPCSLCNELQQECPYFHDVNQIFYRDIHHHLFERTGKEVLIDNSKRVKWSRKLLHDDRYVHKYLHIIKDPRAIYYSLQSRNKPTDIDHWAQRNLEIWQFVFQFELDYYLLTYNELAETIDQTLTDVCRWLELSFEPEQKEYWNFEHHGPGDNSATKSFLKRSRSSDNQFYAQQRKRNFIDLRWKEQLSPRIIHSIEENENVQKLLSTLGLELTENSLYHRKPVDLNM